MITRRQALLLAPFGVATVAAVGGFTVLSRMKAGTFDPKGVPSQLIGRPVPDFELPAQEPGQGFTSADLKAVGRPMLLNFYASWCVPCVIEHPQLMDLAKAGLPIWGVAYKDTMAAAAGFLTKYGNPFQRIGRDGPGQVAIDFGVYGVPESYLLDRGGLVRWRYAGPLTPDVVAEQLRPLLARFA